MDRGEQRLSVKSASDRVFEACIRYGRAFYSAPGAEGNQRRTFFRVYSRAVGALVLESDMQARVESESYIDEPELAWVSFAKKGLRRAAPFLNGVRLDQSNMFAAKNEDYQRQLYNEVVGIQGHQEVQAP